MSDTAAALKEIFEKMPSQVNPEAAKGLNCVIQYDLTGPDGAQYHSVFDDGSCTVVDGKHEAPSMTMTMDAADFVALTNGELDGMSAFMSGKLKIGGDMGLAMRMQDLMRG